MERADCFDIEIFRLFKEILHLRAILANDAEIVSSGFASPVLVGIKRTELAESVGRKEDLIVCIIGHDDFGPMHHRRGHEGERVFTERKGIPLAHDLALGKVFAKKLRHHRKALGRGNDLRFGIRLFKLRNIGAMVGLHMLHDQIVGLSCAEHLCEIIEPCVGKARIDRIKHGDLFIQNHVGVIRHAVWHLVLALK